MRATDHGKVSAVVKLQGDLRVCHSSQVKAGLLLQEHNMMKLALPTALISAFAAPAFADMAIGLAGDRTLVMVDLSSGKVTGMTDVVYEGRLLGIDYRPGTDSLIGVTEGFEVVNIDPQTGQWSLLVKMDTEMAIADGAAVIVDINPAADALRFMSGTTNHRVNLSTGAVMVDGNLSFTDGTMGVPMVGGTAYSNSFGKPEATAMYNIDVERNALLRQTAPNNGDNTMIGALGAMIEGPIGFDIVTDATGMNTAWLWANGAMHTVSLESGAVTGTWQIEGLDANLRDMTVMSAAN